MISRRNIRVKVMQSLYTVASLEQQTKEGEPQKILQQHFDQTRRLFLYIVCLITEIARYAEKDSHTRASKHLPTYADLNINTKLAGNETVWKILEDTSFRQFIKSDRIESLVDTEIVKKIYITLTETPEYKTYINKADREKKDEQEIVEFILDKLILQNETVTSQTEDLFSNWDDDGEMLIQLIVAYLHKPGSVNFAELIGKEKLQFAKSLLQTVIDKNDHLEKMIVPKLKNWDPERIALLDMILMKMGVAEFLYFETIPPKVTINEYIDLAKEYSTAQSGQFVNGILDNINKEMTEQGNMKKVDYKKQ
jgi:transcription antitermination protein NusB